MKQFLSLRAIAKALFPDRPEKDLPNLATRELTPAIEHGDRETLRRIEELLDLPVHKAVREISEKSLAGIFTKEELTGIWAAFNGTMLVDFNFRNPKMTVSAQLEDAIRLEGSQLFYGYNAEQLLAKLGALSELDALGLLLILEKSYTPGGGEIPLFKLVKK